MATFLPRMLTGDVAAPNAGWPDDFGFQVNVRRSSVISGVVFLSWRMGDLFRTVFDEEPREVVLEIFDGTEPLEERRWNTFPPAWLGPVAAEVRKRTSGADASTDPPPHVGGYQPAFTADLLKPNYGEKVLVRGHSTPWFDRQSQRGRAWLVAGAGSLLSMALAGLVFVQTRGRSRAESLAADLAESRELLRRAAAERERLSRDLHDGTVQSLYAVGLGLGRVRRGLGGSAEGERIGHALVELDEVVADLRRFLVELDPGVSPMQRPEAALGELVARMRRVSATELEFTVAPGFQAPLRPAVVLDPQVTRQVIAKLGGVPTAADPSSALDEADRKLLELSAQGLLNKEIAAALGMAEKTVRNRLTRVYARLGVTTRTEAALWFERQR